MFDVGVFYREPDNHGPMLFITFMFWTADDDDATNRLDSVGSQFRSFAFWLGADAPEADRL